MTSRLFVPESSVIFWSFVIRISSFRPVGVDSCPFVVDLALGAQQSGVPMQKSLAKKHPGNRAERQVRSKG
jgi:hypothetical protein